MKTSSKVISNNMESGKYTLSIIKARIEGHLAAMPYWEFHELIVKKTIIRVTMEKMSKLTVT